MTMKDMILIIEDDKDIAAIEKDYMEINGYGAVIKGGGPDRSLQPHPSRCDAARHGRI